jgi:hypothetical protein
MFKLILLSSLVFSNVVVGASVREVYYQADSLTPSNIGPTFVNGYLVVYGRNVSVYSPDGTIAYSISPPEHGFIHNVTVDTDQTAAAAVQVGGKSGVISVFDRTGSQISVIDTGRYLPSFVCFAPDHSIWATGTEQRRSLADKPEYFILRHFSIDGKELGRFLPRSSFEEYDQADPVEAVIGLPGLQIANNRIGAVLNYGGNGGKALWVETDLKGKEIGRWRVNITGLPSVFTSNGAVYARVVGGISALDHATGKWNRVVVHSDGELVGSDGESLVLMTFGTTGLRWVPMNP